jgi:5-methylcytosine-specific restriction endonuclease McrA
MLTKYCARCDQTLPTENFAKNKARYDGLQGMCRSCDRAKRIDWEKRNPKKARERIDRYRFSAHGKAKNSETAARRYQQAKLNGTLKPKKINHFLHAQTQLRRRARLAKNGVYNIIPKDLRRLKNSPCFYCGQKADTLDHIVPVVKGGTHSIGNLVSACRSCNSRKHDRFLVVFKSRIERQHNESKSNS